MKPWQLTATEGIAQIRAGQLSASEWIRSCLDRCHSLEPKLRAWAYLNPELPLRRAEEADHLRQSTGWVGPLESAPLGVKDIFNTMEMPTEMGSPLWRGFTPGNDARVVATLKRLGGIVLGKTVTSEFAVHFAGPTRNPHDLARSPGTSSSGSAVAVASGMVPLALGSQTAGSTIRPASYCGIYGFKPSFGLVPRTGMLKTTDTLDHVSFLARSVQDVRLIFDQARVSGRDHPLVRDRVDPSVHWPDPAVWRMGLVRGPFWHQAQPYVRTALEGLARRLDSMPGIRVEEFSLPEEAWQVHSSHERIYCRALAYYFQRDSRRPDGLSPLFRSMLEFSQEITPEEYRKELQFQAQFSQQMERCFRESGLHLLLDLSTAAEAPIGLQTPAPPDHCLIWTFAGIPSLNVPAFRAPSGQPFGFQLIGRKYEDYRLLRFGQILAASMAAQEIGEESGDIVRQAAV